jgi:hypothetical protein
MEIVARYPGTCSVCDGKIVPGQEIQYKKGDPLRHSKCLPEEIPDPDKAIRLSGGEGYGCRGWVKGQVVKNPTKQSDSRYAKRGRVWELCLNFPCPEDYRVEYKLGQIVVGRGTGGADRVGEYEYLGVACRALGWAETPAVEEIDKLLMEMDGLSPETPPEPKYLFVLQASSRYYREDGMSFGVGDESGRVYFATCRAATDEESASLREKEEEAAKAKEKAKAFRELEKLFEGKYVATEQPILLKGEVVPVGEGQTPYGGGEWFVIAEDKEWIWHVLNNGGDGDDWSQNNIATGGAGAIGRRVPYSEPLEQQIRDLAPFGGR